MNTQTQKNKRQAECPDNPLRHYLYMTGMSQGDFCALMFRRTGWRPYQSNVSLWATSATKPKLSVRALISHATRGAVSMRAWNMK